MIPENPDFHAHHSPMGAHSSLTLGMFGAKGGAALEKGKAAEGGCFAGYKDSNGAYTYLPFFESQKSDKDRYVTEDNNKLNKDIILGKNDIEREYLWATDRFNAPGINLEIITPFGEIPDPELAPEWQLKFALCPATLIKISFDNQTALDWQGFFALSSENFWSPLKKNDASMLTGSVSRNRIAIATLDKAADNFMDFTVDSSLSRKHTSPNFLLGQTAGISISIPAGSKKSLTLAVAYFIDEAASFNRDATYLYKRYFANIQQVLAYALENQQQYFALAAKRDQELESKSHLNDEQKFLIAHATRSYFGSTELLDEGGKALWIVNEGEYLMMNTFDLTVDMMFFELRFNPWTVKNVLENFVNHYRYYDQVFAPGEPDKLLPGGISFAHDMGVGNHFSPEPYSSYEVSGLDRECFSFMTCEQLTNWVLTAGVYIGKTQDKEFLIRHKGIFKDCLESLLNRDNPNADLRNGLMGFDSSMTKGGGEITTYDSLDHSLGQARNNIYLAGKMWASYVIIEKLFTQLGDKGTSKSAKIAALRTSSALTAGFDHNKGFIPAVLEGDNQSAIIPAIEALVYPWEAGFKEVCSIDGEYGEYIKTLIQHFNNIHNTDTCLYPDGAWKLSSSADNSWMSKICLCQYVAREILGFDLGESGLTADIAHSRWQREGSKAHACSDQFASGIAMGSLYYPRIVTNILWMEESHKAKTGFSVQGSTYSNNESIKIG